MGKQMSKRKNKKLNPYTCAEYKLDPETESDIIRYVDQNILRLISRRLDKNGRLAGGKITIPTSDVPAKKSC